MYGNVLRLYEDACVSIYIYIWMYVDEDVCEYGGVCVHGCIGIRTCM